MSSDNDRLPLVQLVMAGDLVFAVAGKVSDDGLQLGFADELAAAFPEGMEPEMESRVLALFLREAVRTCETKLTQLTGDFAGPLPSASEILDTFSTWQDALLAAGMEPGEGDLPDLEVSDEGGSYLLSPSTREGLLLLGELRGPLDLTRPGQGSTFLMRRSLLDDLLARAEQAHCRVEVAEVP